MVNKPYAQNKHLAGINLDQNITTSMAPDSKQGYKTNPIRIIPK
jgi:hypothetical protein